MRLYINLIILIAVISIAGCAAAKQANRADYYTYEQMKEAVYELKRQYPEIVTIHDIGKTNEGRSIFVLEINPKAEDDGKPGLLAVFAQHADEHETTKLGMAFANHLLEEYKQDPAITQKLTEKTVYIIPMANPDGVDYDLSSEKTFATWRKNCNSIGEADGVDLNRNWDYQWDAPVNKEVESSRTNPKDASYRGPRPFSELETKSISEFIMKHKNIKTFVDYHTGTCNFIQGEILLPFCYTKEQKLSPEEAEHYKAVSRKICSLISDAKDTRARYAAVRAYQVRDYVFRKAPLLLKPFVWFSLPSSTVSTGAGIDWAAAHGMLAFGIETSCRDDFNEKYQENHEILVNHQYNGFLYLLDGVK